MTERIRWEPTKYGGWTGHIGSLEPWAFQVWQVDGPDSPWRLDSALLSQFGYHVDHPDPEVLKPHAERWLAEFVSSLGAVFADVLYDKIETERDARLEEAVLAAQDDDEALQAVELSAGAGALGWVLSVMDRTEAAQ
jgi:hypothetical protein